MITYLEGDLFSSPAQTLVNTVNTVGVMEKALLWNSKRDIRPCMSNTKSIVMMGVLQLEN